jgi:hypothetical protein
MRFACRIQRRVLVAERNFPPAEYAKLLRKRARPYGAITAFCKKHDVCLDWLMDGQPPGACSA